MDDDQFRRLLEWFGLSWAGYRRVRGGAKKRIRRHMGRCGCASMDSYLKALERNSGMKDACEQLLTVSISRFFRDRRLWDYLAAEVLPALACVHPETIRIWSAGCASGEEVYSLAIMRHLLRKNANRPPEIEILATDMNPAYLARARAGIYEPSSLREVPPGLRSSCFEEQSGGESYAIKPVLKRGIAWRIHHLLSEPPAGDFHLVLLRNNLLTYYEDDLMRPAFRRILESMASPAFLAVGSHEALPEDSAGLLQPTANPCVYRKVRAGPAVIY